MRTARDGERELPADLKERELTRGWLKASHRALDPKRSKPWRPWHPLTRAAQQKVTPGEITEYAIDILATANLFRRGHRICVEIASADMPSGVGGATNVEYVPNHIVSSKTTLHKIYHDAKRPSHLLPQVQGPRHWNPQAVFNGMLLIVEGLFRKVVIADNCALIANAAFNGNFGPPSTVTVLLAVYAFAWQIYGDFSGYSDIARGSAQLLGFHFMVNFRQPYLATSLQDFVSVVRDLIAGAPVKHMDETGLRIGGKTRWLHVAATALLTFYRVCQKRGSLLANVVGTVVHDHWKPYRCSAR